MTIKNIMANQLYTIQFLFRKSVFISAKLFKNSAPCSIQEKRFATSKL